MFSAALRCWRSSVSRCVSSIQVENVVYEPTAAVPGEQRRVAAEGEPGEQPEDRPRRTG